MARCWASAPVANRHAVKRTLTVHGSAGFIVHRAALDANLARAASAYAPHRGIGEETAPAGPARRFPGDPGPGWGREARGSAGPAGAPDIRIETSIRAAWSYIPSHLPMACHRLL